MSLGLALGDAAFVVNPVPDCQPALRFNEEGILFEGQSLQVAIHAAGGCAHLCFSFSKLPVCFRDLLCPPVTDGRGVAIGVVVEWKAMTVLDSDCGDVAKHQSEAPLPAQRIVLAPEERQDAELVAQAQDHIAEDEGPLPGAHEQQSRASALVDVVDPLGLDFHEPTLEGKGRMRKPGGAFRKSRRVISHETDPLQWSNLCSTSACGQRGAGDFPGTM